MRPKLVFLFIPYHNTGGHFIHWSLGWLSGQKHYWSIKNKLNTFNTVDVISNNNFHQHECDCICGFNDVKAHSEMLLQQITQPVHFVYISIKSFSQALHSLFDVKPADATPLQCQQAFQYINSDTKQMLTWIQEHHYKLIIFNYHSDDLLNLVYNNRYPTTGEDKNQKTSDEVVNYYESTFFKQTSEKFDDTIWDRREKLSLILQEIKYYNYHEYIDRFKPHLYYTTDDVWNDFVSLIKEILIYIDEPLLEHRLDDWKKLYYAWREKHQFSFSRNFNKIIDAIVNGYYMNLTRYNMNFYNEVLIQQALIRRHNLNLKTWQLDKLPNNTQDIHKLLEPNIHSI